ncbi:hypothetical protein TorRG33x02_348690, partial [Trema orientale]
VPRGHAQELIRSKLVGSEAAELETPLSGAMEHNQDIIKKQRSSVSITAIHSRNASHSRNGGLDPLSHIGYTELKITSDSESDVPFSDDDEGASALICETTNDYMDEFSVQCIEPSIATLDGVVASDKLIDPASGPKPSPLVSEVQVDAIESFDYKSQESAIAIGHGLEELNWQQVEDNANIPAQTKVPLSAAPSTHTVGTPVEVSKAAILQGLIKLGTHLWLNVGMSLRKELRLAQQANQLAVGNRGKQLSGLLAEQLIGKDLKLLLSQLSVTRGIEQPMNEISPKLSINTDDLKTSDSSNSIGIQILQKRISLERNDLFCLWMEALSVKLRGAGGREKCVEKEKEIQDLEAELELYRKKFLDERVLEIPAETSCDVITDIGVDITRNTVAVEKDLITATKVEDACNSFENTDEDNLNSSILEFEYEKMYILQCLKKLEKAPYQLPDGEVSAYLSKDNNPGNITCGLSESDEHSEAEVNILSMQHLKLVSLTCSSWI